MGKRFFNIFKLYISLGIIGLLFLLLDAGSEMLALFMKEGPKRRWLTRLWLRKISSTACWCLHHTGILRLDIPQLKEIQSLQENVIFIANHPSRLDTVILTGLIPNMVCITKPTIWNGTILGPTLRQGGYICFDRILKIIGQAKKRLNEGCPLFVFPEGTRTGPMQSPETFLSGFSALALGTQASIQFLYIETDSPYLAQGWSYLKCPHHLPMNYRVTLGPHFTAPKNEAEGRELLKFFSDFCHHTRPTPVKNT